MTKDNQADKATRAEEQQASNVVYLPGAAPEMQPSVKSVVETLELAQKRAEEAGYDQLVLIMKRSDDHGMAQSSVFTDGTFDAEVIMMAEVVKAMGLSDYMNSNEEDTYTPVS